MSKTRGLLFGVGFSSFVLVAALAFPFGASPAFAYPAAGYLPGCTGEYFNNTTLAGSPVLVRTDPAIDFFWPEGTSPGPGVNVSQYSVRWTCTVNVPTTGTYTFNMVTDDGMNLLIDGNLIFWAWYDQGPSAYAKSVYLNAGVHTIVIQYYNNTLGGTAEVSTDIPGTVAYYPPSYPVPSTGGFLTGCTGAYYNNIGLAGSPTFVRTDPALDFYWPQGTSPGPGIYASNYSVEWTCPVNVPSSGTYTFNVLTDDGMNVYVDGNLLIGAWYDQPPTAHSNSIYLNAGAHTVVVQYYNHTLGGTAEVSSNVTGTSAYYPPAPAPAPYYSGLITSCTGQYYNNTTLAGSPVLVRTDPGINFYWPEWTSPGPGVAVNNYSVGWTCAVNVPTSGTYTLSMVTDDGMNVLVDGNLILWAWYDQGPTSYTKSVYLSAGTHTVYVQYYNHTLGGTAEVSLH